MIARRAVSDRQEPPCLQAAYREVFAALAFPERSGGDQQRHLCPRRQKAKAMAKGGFIIENKAV